MTAPLLVLRVGYMERYDGPDTITAGGSFIDANGVGGEVFNFEPSRGKCYGYAMSLHFSGVNLGFIDNSRSWSLGDELTGVDVVFIARRQGYGQVVVGWYRDATVFHRQYRVKRGRIPGMESEPRQFLCVAKAGDALLLPENSRTFEVPAGQAGHKGFPGRSNVWYPAHNYGKPGVSAFVKNLQQYIARIPAKAIHEDNEGAPSGGSKGGGGRTGQPDASHNAEVEQAAVNATIDYYTKSQYKYKLVESENKGWDLEVTKGKSRLYVEVKGTASAAVYFELTPNEYCRMQEHADCYRVCMVCNALDDADRCLFELLPLKTDGTWELRSADGKVYVPLTERIAAVGVEVRQSAET